MVSLESRPIFSIMRHGVFSNCQMATYRAPAIPLFAFLIAILSCTVAAEDANPKSKFIFPDKEWVLSPHLHDTVLVSYISSFPTPGLYIWCGGDNGPRNIFAQEPSASFNGTQPVYFNFTSDTPCWWNLRREFNTPDGANGPGFDIIPAERPGGPMTISAPPPSSSTSSTTSSPTSTTSSVNSINTTGSASDDNKGLSSTAATGIGVGVGVVVAVLFCAAIIWFRNWKKREATEGAKVSGESYEYSGTPTASASRAGTWPYASYTYQESLTPKEMPASREVAELAVESQTIEMPAENCMAEILTTDYQQVHVRQGRYV